jgi:hypothetical protein
MTPTPEHMSIEGQLLWIKAEEIIATVKLISDIVADNNESLLFVKNDMMQNAYLLQVKVSGAEAVELYDLKMECACLIRKAAKDLWVQKHSLKMFGFEETEYFEIIHRQIEDYRMIFIQWVAKFDKWNYAIDRWGLFNPPGVSPYGKEIDEG